MKRVSFPVLGVLIALVVAIPAVSRAAETPNEVVEKSVITLQAFLEGQEGRALRPLLDKTVAVIVLPEYIRGGIGLGGEGGTGVLMSRASSGGAWGKPLFVDAGGVTLGPQLGVETSQVVLVILDEMSLKALLEGNATFGGEAAAVAGSEGAGVRAMTVKGGTDDSIYIFARSKGAYAGAILKGGRIDLKQAWNVDSVRTESAQRLQRLLETR